MDGGWLPVQGPAQDAAWRAVLRPLAGEFRKVVPELAVEMLEHVKAEMPHLFPDAQSEEEARASGVVNFLLFADSLEHGLDPRDFELPPVTAAVMRAVVHRRGSVAERMRLFRMAHALVWPWFFDHINAAAEDPAQRAAAVELATRWLFTYVDNAVTRAEAAYDVEREAWLQGNAAERTAAVEAILARRETDPARAGRRLRFEVNRSHVGVVVWVETVRDDADAHPELMEAITCLGRAVDVQHVLPHPLGSLAVAAWLSGRRELPFEELRSAVDACAGELPAGVRVALGDPAPGLEGFRQTHLDAAHARRFASLVGSGAGQVIHFRKVAVAALASVDRDLAVSFVHRALGPLADPDETTYRVAMTLAVFLDENRSRSRAAERLVVHPNTVSYRVRQAEVILGRSIDVDSVELQIALALLPALPRLAQ